ncbi:hypothetical protein BGX27_011480, partial [Mortierella sp. AM989]
MSKTFVDRPTRTALQNNYEIWKRNDAEGAHVAKDLIQKSRTALVPSERDAQAVEKGVEARSASSTSVSSTSTLYDVSTETSECSETTTQVDQHDLEDQNDSLINGDQELDKAVGADTKERKASTNLIDEDEETSINSSEEHGQSNMLSTSTTSTDN